jgi:hypothetical protein
LDNAVPFESLASSDLIVDAIYSGGSAKNVTDDPIAKLLPVGNSGGIRYLGKRTAPQMVALLTSGQDLDWPDRFNEETGVFEYFGDNKSEGKELHDTPRGGNVVLRNLFDGAHGGASGRARVAPIFVFMKAAVGRDYRFLGLAVPGAPDTGFLDDLVGVWRSTNRLRYQNYKATFTVLDVATISRAWLTDIANGDGDSSNAPAAWVAWRTGGVARALRTARTIEHRTRLEQEPATDVDRAIVNAVYNHFSERPYDFEAFAADLVKSYLPDVASLDVTRRSRDGGRDAIGQYRVGFGGGEILLDFSVEAKCYKPGNSVGVRELSRLISRLRHRQFGVLVTTSHLDTQAYKELKEDAHPIVVIAGIDIARILKMRGIEGIPALTRWLVASFPDQPTRRS